MRNRRVLALLKQIAKGLPVAVGPLVVGASVGGCTHCYSLPVASSSHPRSALVESLIGPPEAFDPDGCEALCRMLDFGERDAGGGDADTLDAGPPLLLVTTYPERVRARCHYFDDGASIACFYAEDFCETNASCNPTTYGRAPAGLLRPRPHRASPVARWLAEGAHLEAASVPAFEDVAAELTRFGAPAALIAAAQRSASDERRHARQLRALAGRLGAPVEGVRRAEIELRDLEALALDNAIEGCVHEAYAALAAALQAERAASATARGVFSRIAADEARHALLSFDMNDWLAPHLSPSARRRAGEARRQAIAQLSSKLETEPDPTLRDVLGVPDATRSNDLTALIA